MAGSGYVELGCGVSRRILGPLGRLADVGPPISPLFPLARPSPAQPWWMMSDDVEGPRAFLG